MLADHEAKPIGLREQMNDLCLHVANDKDLAISESIKSRRPPSILNTILLSEHPLQTANGLASAYPWHVTFAISQLSSEIPSGGRVFRHAVRS